MKASIQVSLWFGMKEEGQESKISFDVRRLILPTKPGLEISWHWNTKRGRQW